jgi:8-oxo-dGTP diphosphatase
LHFEERLLNVKEVKDKVFAYITHNDHLLIFSHPYALEAGIQVPAGTVEENEHPEDAVLREAFEETGLSNLSLDCFLGEQRRDMSDYGRNEIHRRLFYHLRYDGPFIARWRQGESDPYDGLASDPIIFEFFWARLPHHVPPLIADQGIMLPQLLERLRIKNM